MFNSRSYFIVRKLHGDGYIFLSLPGEWSYREVDAMKFPHAAMAASHAKRFNGEVREVVRV